MGKLYFPAYRRPKTTLKTPHLRITLYPKAARSSLFWHYFCNFYIYSFTEFENSINLTKSLASFGLCSKHVSYSPMDLRMPKRQCNLQIAWAVSSHAFFPTSTSGSQWHYVPLWLAIVRKKKNTSACHKSQLLYSLRACLKPETHWKQLMGVTAQLQGGLCTSRSKQLAECMISRHQWLSTQPWYLLRGKGKDAQISRQP